MKIIGLEIYYVVRYFSTENLTWDLSAGCLLQLM